MNFKCVETRMPALNDRFDASGAVAPESLCKFASFATVRMAVEASPAPSSWDVFPVNNVITSTKT